MHFKQYKKIVQGKGRMNLTRGCIHGCIYCDSRSACYQMNHAFTDIEIKANACQMLDDELSRKRKKIMITTGAMSDPYMNIPEVLDLTRCCLKIIDKHGFGLSFQTKSTLFLRDLEYLVNIHKRSRLVVQMTLTTADDDLCRLLEPGVDVTSKRVEALRILQENHIPTVVWISPILPMINDALENIKGVLNACLDVGVKGVVWFGASLTLREGNREYYYQKLDEIFPGMKEKYIQTYGLKYVLTSQNHQLIHQYVVDFCEKHQILYKPEDVFEYIEAFQPIWHEQLKLF
jgi:DNA repair photolyase